MKTEYLVTINDHKQNVSIDDSNEVFIKAKKFNYELIKTDMQRYTLKLDNKVHEIMFDRVNGEKINLLVDGHQIETITRTVLQEKAFQLLEKAKATAHRLLEVNAPMPGIILKIKKQSGEKVRKGESVIILEAMKMENEIKAPSNGIITRIAVSEGKVVEKNSFLFAIE